MTLRIVMAYTRHGDTCHLVNGDDLAVTLCGRTPHSFVRRYEKTTRFQEEALVLYSAHWANRSLGGADVVCYHCEAALARLRR